MLTAKAPDWTARWRNEGREQGRNEGRQQGRKEGEAALLLRQLTRRFGVLDPSLRRKVETADAEQLLEWGERFVTARSLAEVFEEGE